MELTARMVKDAEVKRTKDNRELVAFTVVINDRYKSKDGEKKEESTFFNCSYWLSTDIAKHLKKGMIVTLFGRVGLNAYKTKDGDYYSHLTFHANYIKIVAGVKSIVAADTATEGTPASKDDLPF